ncbi:HalOD1 output domain-containing protein [Halorussus salinisoli]|uniref:HalOD1 output domain-containing protein n=1 Tax=Halorussus salinisoli TaxID=2558242 RepID=UPI0014852D28
MQTTDTAITFDAATNTYQLHHDWRDDESVTTAVIMGVAAITNTPPTDLGPVFEMIDPDALNNLFHPPTSGSSRDDGWVSFCLNDCAVRVYATGEIEITPDEDDTPATTGPQTIRDR